MELSAGGLVVMSDFAKAESACIHHSRVPVAVVAMGVGRKNSHQHYLTLGDGQPLFVTLCVTVGELAHCCLHQAKRLLVALNLSVRASRGWQSSLK
jgi:hypothetical protein